MNFFRITLAIAMLAAITQVSAAIQPPVAANGAYFKDHTFGLLSDVSGNDLTGPHIGTFLGQTFSITKTLPANNAFIGSGFQLNENLGPNNSPWSVGTAWPQPGPNGFNFLDNPTISGSAIRYDFASNLPVGTHIYFYDMDGTESLILEFEDALNVPVNPTAFDYIPVTPNAPVPTFSAANITMASPSNSGYAAPVGALIVKSSNVRSIVFSNTVPFSGGGFGIGLSYPVPKAASGSATAIPSLGFNALLLLATLLGGSGFLYARRRQ